MEFTKNFISTREVTWHPLYSCQGPFCRFIIDIKFLVNSMASMKGARGRSKGRNNGAAGGEKGGGLRERGDSDERTV